MHSLHSLYAACPIVGHDQPSYMPAYTAGAFSSLPCALLRSLLAGPVPATLWLRSPLERGHIFFSAPCTNCMADMSDIVLSTGPIEFILTGSLRRAPYPPPSDPVSRHRTEIVSSSLDQGSLAERISSSLALCPTLDLASAQSSALSSDRAFFLLITRRQGLFALGAGSDATICSRARYRTRDPCAWRIPWALPSLSAS
jgi:hypothetical protein